MRAQGDVSTVEFSHLVKEDVAAVFQEAEEMLASLAEIEARRKPDVAAVVAKATNWHPKDHRYPPYPRSQGLVT
jgi:hypothetical protein